MTIDERLEALTQSMEPIAAMQRDNETRFDARFTRIEEAIEKDAQNIRALARIAESHEHRLEQGNL